MVQIHFLPLHTLRKTCLCTYAKGGEILKRKRNTTAFTFLAWASFAISVCFFLIAIWNTEWALVEKGYYAGIFIWAVYSAFVLSKVIRDNEEDREDGVIPPQNFSFRNKED